jgi:hypothetical protein
VTEHRVGVLTQDKYSSLQIINNALLRKASAHKDITMNQTRGKEYWHIAYTKTSGVLHFQHTATRLKLEGLYILDKNATNTTNATNATDATNATIATNTTNATIATNATNATNATHATSVTSAQITMCSDDHPNPMIIR